MKYKFDSEQHLHELDNGSGFKPLTGTSSIGNVLAKPLTWWAAGLAVEKFGWMNPKKNSPESVKTALQEGWERVKGLDLKDYGKLLTEAYYAHSAKLKDTAKTGTDLHAELEHFVKATMGLKPMRADYDKKIQPFIDWTEKNVKRFIASEAHCFDEELFVGGITDCIAELNDGKLAIIDFKSSKEAYINQFIQVAGYSIQVEKNGLFSEDGEYNKKLEGKIEVLIVVPFGAEVVEPSIRYDVESYKQGFRSAVVLYRLLGLEGKN